MDWCSEWGRKILGAVSCGVKRVLQGGLQVEIEGDRFPGGGGS